MKQTNLLRPFDLESAKKGALICHQDGDIEWSYAAGPDSEGTYILLTQGTKRQFTFPTSADILRMKPLCWIEDKPVYPGDVLYWNNITSAPGTRFTVGYGFTSKSLLLEGVSKFENGMIRNEPGTGMPPEKLTWEKSKFISYVPKEAIEYFREGVQPPANYIQVEVSK